jgi:hypothetical protein
VRPPGSTRSSRRLGRRGNASCGWRFRRRQAEQRILAVTFRTPDGRRWSAIGGGATVDDAIGSARETCSDAWAAVAWDDLYGE